jgi:hypothetical protein
MDLVNPQHPFILEKGSEVEASVTKLRIRVKVISLIINS